MQRGINMTLETAGKNDYAQIKRLYRRAFPREERAPFFIMKKRALEGKGEALVAKEDGEFIGFLYLITYKDLVYLFYFAIDDSRRKKGYGSRILQQLKQRYEGKRLFLAREKLDKSAPNYQQRVKRHEFYMKNGFHDMPYQIREASVIYDVMGVGGDVSAKEYDELILSWSGKIIKRMIKMSLSEKSN